MIILQRFIVIQAIKTNNNELIPIWDKRVSFEKTNDYGNVINIKDDYHNYCILTECVYDLKTKELSIGIELDLYPDLNKLSYKKDDIVYVEAGHHELYEAKIVDIIFEEFDLDIKRGKKLDSFYIEKFKNITIDKEAIYAIKKWKPFYKLDNGKIIEWEHELYKKKKNLEI